MRVGGNATFRLNVRLIAATNRDLAQAVEKGSFRRDLYYRLKVVSLSLPPLRERKEDIPLLVWQFVQLFSQEHRKAISSVDSDAMEELMRYSWPGNVRELKNLIENIVIFSKGERVKIDDLPVEIRLQTRESNIQFEQSSPLFENLNMEAVEKQAIMKALEKTKGNRLKASQLLGIGLRTLQKKLKDYGMTER
jgi:DNA-binding NtrC family response regulator